MASAISSDCRRSATPRRSSSGHDVTIQDVFEAVGKYAAGKISTKDFKTLEDKACPNAGACGGQFTANTMSTAFAILGISPLGTNIVPAMDPKKDEVCYQSGQLIMNLLRKDITPKKIITRKSIENAIAAFRISYRVYQLLSYFTCQARAAKPFSDTKASKVPQNQ